MELLIATRTVFCLFGLRDAVATHPTDAAQNQFSPKEYLDNIGRYSSLKGVGWW